MTGLAPVQPYRRVIAGHVYDFTNDGQWVEVVDPMQAASTASADDIEALMVGRTAAEAETGRRLLRERKARRGSSAQSATNLRQTRAAEDGRLVGSREARRPAAVQVILGGVTNT